jgi:hypothetical protein
VDERLRMVASFCSKGLAQESAFVILILGRKDNCDMCLLLSQESTSKTSKTSKTLACGSCRQRSSTTPVLCALCSVCLGCFVYLPSHARNFEA